MPEFPKHQPGERRPGDQLLAVLLRPSKRPNAAFTRQRFPSPRRNQRRQTAQCARPTCLNERLRVADGSRDDLNPKTMTHIWNFLLTMASGRKKTSPCIQIVSPRSPYPHRSRLIRPKREGSDALG